MQDLKCNISWLKEFNHENTKAPRHESKYEFEKISKTIIGAAIEVHKELGPGFLENIYLEALKISLKNHGLEYDTQKKITIKYQNKVVGAHYLDLLVNKEIIVELKAVRALDDSHFAQLRSYLKATGLSVGLLMNFAKSTLVVRRVVN